MSLIKPANFLLPKENIDLKKWAVIACDQFTQNNDYWKSLIDYCGEYSTLNLIYPEIFLGDNEEKRIKNINKNMKKYLADNIFDEFNGFVLTERITKYNKKRVGLICLIDLEEYDFERDLKIRATEATVKERLPIRVKIRQNATLELPHALVLIDDIDKTVIEPLYKNKDNYKKLYQTELNMQGGSITGYLIEDTKPIIDKILALATPDIMLKKYGNNKQFIMAVGDGNHSIATAKVCWENLKKTLTSEQIKNHPQRYCMVEINNLYDEDLTFEPIYRVVYDVKEDFLTGIKMLKGENTINVIYNNMVSKINVNSNSAKAISDIQAYIDDYLFKFGGKQDYIHGYDHLIEATKKLNGYAIVMPKLDKTDLFKYIANFGPLTRKSFSMGEPEEKRYYLECRKIT